MKSILLCGDHYTSGQLLRHGLFLSWNKFGREVFCSFAIILCKASFSSPSLSKICKRMKQEAINHPPLTAPLASSLLPPRKYNVNSPEQAIQGGGMTSPDGSTASVPCTGNSILCNLETQEPLESTAAVCSKPL